MRKLVALILLAAAVPAAANDKEMKQAVDALNKHFKSIDAIARIPLPGVRTNMARFEVASDGELDLERYQHQLRKFPPVLNTGDSIRRLYFKAHPKEGVLVMALIRKKLYPQSVVGITFGRRLEASDVTREMVVRATAGVIDIAGEVVPTDFDPEALAAFLAGEGAAPMAPADPLQAPVPAAPSESIAPPVVYNPKLKVLSAEVDPVNIRPGSEVRLSIHFELSGVPPGRRVPVTVERQLYFQGEPQFPSAETSTEEWEAGRQTSSTVLPVPDDTPTGVFRLVVTVRGAGTEQSKEALFVVE